MSTTTSVAHQAGRMADLMPTTPLRAVTPRGRHRQRVRVDVELHLAAMAVGALLVGFVYLIGGPW
jgi:hypothetical protein